ncbi:MAG: sterol desaturase family protein [Bdellovibrionia bacterium]
MSTAAEILNVYWQIIDGTNLLLLIAILLPLEFLFPVTPVPLKKRLPQFLFVIFTFPLILLAMKLSFAVLSGTDFTVESLMNYGEIPEANLGFLPALNLAPFFQAIPFPGVVFALLFLFLSDGALYWWHRAMHRIEILWAFHKMHHQDDNLNLFTSNVAHPFHSPFWTFFANVLKPYVILCAGSEIAPSGSADAVLTYLVAIKAQGWLIHSNTKISFGPLNWILVSPQVHRIHHSKDAKYRDMNYTNFFPFWDIVFGTYYFPKKNEWPETGIEGEPFPTSQWELAIQPFKVWKSWLNRRMIRTA